MFDIGASLAAARETRGYSLADCERLTHVRVKYLSALERADFDALPGRTYARAFLRTYATALGLEADRFVAAFEEMVPEPEDEPIAVVTPRRHRIRSSYFMALVGVAVIVGVAAWGASSHDAKTLAPPPAAAAAVVQPKVRPKPAKPKAVVVHHHAAPKVRPAALVIRASRGNCWLLVRQGGANGPVVYQGTLRLGTSVRFAAPSLWVRFGAPWNVDAARGGKALSGLGGSSPVDVTV